MESIQLELGRIFCLHGWGKSVCGAFILFPTDAWVNFKLFGSLVLMLVFVIIQSLMLNKYLDKEESK